MPDWSIKIVPSATKGKADFMPDLKGAKPGDPLKAQEADLVTWNNTTDDPHQPWQTNESFVPLDNGALSDQNLAASLVAPEL